MTFNVLANQNLDKLDKREFIEKCSELVAQNPGPELSCVAKTQKDRANLVAYNLPLILNIDTTDASVGTWEDLTGQKYFKQVTVKVGGNLLGFGKKKLHLECIEEKDGRVTAKLNKAVVVVLQNNVDRKVTAELVCH
jgi:hypothetical protein